VIPRDHILEWRARAPWPQDIQVEQDLVVSRALVEIFSHPVLHDALAFRGGTALYTLHLPAARYSEDIDLVQTEAQPAGAMMDALRGVLDPWLGKPRYKQAEGRVTFVYRFDSEDIPPLPLRLKVETNTREHFSVYGLKELPFRVESRWFSGSCSVHTYELDELLGTKLRALYQRKQGRDLFDMATALKDPNADAARIVAAFLKYMEHEGHKITRAQFEENFALKLRDPEFIADISPLLAPEFHWEPEAEAAVVSSRLVALLPGEPWKREPDEG
jgi:predicted nucleotidyltransferase component of viral defense system